MERNFTGIFSLNEITVLQLIISRSSTIHHTSPDSILLPIASANVSPERRNVLQEKKFSKRSGTG